MTPRRVDANTSEIVATLMALSWSWIDMHTVGGTFDGLAVHLDGDTWQIIPVEIKSKSGKLTPAETAFHERYPGLVHIWRTAEEVISDCRRLPAER